MYAILTDMAVINYDIILIGNPPPIITPDEIKLITPRFCLIRGIRADLFIVVIRFVWCLVILLAG